MRESQRTPNPHFFQVLGFTPTLGQSKVATLGIKLPAFLLPITWATDVRMTNARAFSISTLQELLNDTKDTPMRGVLGLVVEL